jgi:hypothetical protein
MEFVVSAMVDNAPQTLNVQPMRRVVGASIASAGTVTDPSLNAPGQNSNLDPNPPQPSTAGNLRPEDGTAASDPNVRSGRPSGSSLRTSLGSQTSVPVSGGGWRPTNLSQDFATGEAALAEPGRSEPFEGAV